MAVLASSIINRVLDQFRYRDPVLTVNSAVGTSDVTVDVDDFLPNVGPGNIIQINDEYLLVTAVSGSDPMTLSVKRGWLGSTADVTHAKDDPVYVNPRVLGTQVIDLINEAMDIMYPKLYATDIDTLTFSGSTIGYGLSANCNGVIRVDYEDDSRSKFWKEIIDWVYKDNADTTDFPNGKAIMIQRAMVAGSGIRVIYRKPFTRIASSSDDLIAVAGLSEYMTNTLYYYAMARLMSLEEVDRSNVTGAAAHQRAQDVPAFLALRTAQWYNKRFEDLMSENRIRLFMDVKPRSAATGYGN